MEEKERKKKEALEEKEHKKAERIEKKRQREAEQKRKAEERQKRAEAKAKKAREVAEKKKGKRQVIEMTEKAHDIESVSYSDATDISMPSRKRARKQQQTENKINTDMCCVCCVFYSEDVVNGSGSDWIECACGRWLHEECAEDCIVGSDGKERFCPICL